MSKHKSSRLDEVRAKLSAPVIAAPMFLVSNPALSLAVCGEGMIGSFPAHGTRSREALVEWMDEMDAGLARLREERGADRVAPYAVNLVVHATNARMPGDLDLIEARRVPIVLTSKSSPGDVVKRIHAYGGVVISDIATRRHAEKAAEAGVDGLILVCAGAGGHTGSINPFTLYNEVREVFDGPIVLAGGITTGRDVFAAQMMGADFAYIGTRFLATRESAATDDHREMILRARSTDIFNTAALDGAPANFISESLVRAGIDLDELRVTRPGKIVGADSTSKRWKDIWSAGQAAGAIHDIPSAADLCRRIVAQYNAAKAEARALLS
ncbi:MAG: NAD(P)H-dependent flavin oxidoreductase [Hyphomonadaceae bacterium]